MVAESEKVYTSSVAMIFSSCLLATFFGIGSYMMYNEAFQDAFIASIIGAVISCLFFYFFYYIFEHNTYNTIFELSCNSFGKVFGTILNLVIVASLVIITCAILFNLSSFLNLEYLPDSPTNMLEAILLLTLSYVCSKSLSQILKVNQIFVFICMFNIILNVIGLFPKFEIRNIEPMFDVGKISIIKSVGIYVVLSFVSYFMLLIANKKMIQDKNVLKKRIIISLISTNAVLVGIIFLAIVLLGKEYIALFRFPEYIGLKQFALFNMIERIENILSLQLYFNAFSLLMFLIYFIKSYLPSGKYTRYYPFIITFFVYFITNFLFKDTMSFIMLVEKYYSYVILIGLVVPVALIYTKLHFFTKLPK